MPRGQSGRTPWNVPKLSNRFQVLRATSQPPHRFPTIPSSCVSSVARFSAAISPPTKNEGKRAVRWCRALPSVGTKDHHDENDGNVSNQVK